MRARDNCLSMTGKLWNGKLITEIVEICLARRHQRRRWQLVSLLLSHPLPTILLPLLFGLRNDFRSGQPELPSCSRSCCWSWGTSRKSAYEFAGCSTPFPVQSSQFAVASFQFHFELRAAATIFAQGNARQANHMWGSVAKVLPQSNNIYWKCIITWKVDTNEQCLLLILMRFAALFEPQLFLLLPSLSLSCLSLLASRKFLLRKLLQVGGRDKESREQRRRGA